MLFYKEDFVKCLFVSNGVYEILTGKKKRQSYESQKNEFWVDHVFYLLNALEKLHTEDALYIQSIYTLVSCKRGKRRIFNIYETDFLFKILLKGKSQLDAQDKTKK